MDLSSVIAKIVKLRALAANNTSENEMKAATAAADRMMQEYRITIAEIEAADAGQAEPFVTLKVSEGGRRTAWRETLLWALTAHYGCCWYFSSYRSRITGKGVQSYTVVGRKSDVEIVQYMFSWLEKEIERLCRWHAGGKGVGYAASWLVGCAQGVNRQLADLREAQRAEAAQSSAMVVLDGRCSASKAEMTRLIGKGKPGKSIGGGSRMDARSDGYGVGKQIQIKQGLNGGGTVPALT